MTNTERDDLIESLDRHRFFLRYAVRDMTDEQARLRSTVSELTLGGLIKHVAAVERTWAAFIEHGMAALPDWNDPAVVAEYAQQHHMLDDETLAGLLADYAAVAERTNRLVRDLPDLDAARPLPQAPWFDVGAAWSARRTLLHIIAETSQHAGHADIIRESIDGAKTMG